MRAAGAVDHRSGGPARGDDRLREHVLHPIPARDPSPVVPEAGRLEPGPHREQVLDRDRALGRIEAARLDGEELTDGLVRPAQITTRDGDADERRDEALRRALDVGRRRPTRAAVVSLADDDSPPLDEQAPESRQLGGTVVGASEARGVEPGRACRPNACRYRTSALTLGGRRGVARQEEPQPDHGPRRVREAPGCAAGGRGGEGRAGQARRLSHVVVSAV
jgi:hypothetical protein